MAVSPVKGMHGCKIREGHAVLGAQCCRSRDGHAWLCAPCRACEAVRHALGMQSYKVDGCSVMSSLLLWLVCEAPRAAVGLWGSWAGNSMRTQVLLQPTLLSIVPLLPHALLA